MRKVIVNSTPLIALAKSGRLDLLRRLYGHIVIPEASMLEEVTDRVKELLDHEGIHHSTLELETRSSHCHDHDCCAH